MDERIDSLFKNEHISRVIYVDDDFEIEGFRDNLLNYLLDHNDVAEAEPFFFNNGVDYDTLFSSWWKSTEETVKREQIKRLGIEVGHLSLGGVIDSEMIERLTPGQFKEKYTLEEIGKLDGSNRLLILMDKDLSLDDGRTGINYLEEIKDCPNVISALFSSTFTKEKEYKQWSDGNYDPDYYPFAKERLGGGAEVIIEGLKYVLWAKHISSIKTGVLDMMASALKSAQDKTQRMSPISFDRAVMASSQEEGCWEIDTFERMFMVLMDYYVLDQTKDKFIEYQNNIKSLRFIRSVSDITNESKDDFLTELREKEIFINGDYLNSTYAPIDNGDMFEINGVEYILLAQSCNLSVRGNGKRQSNLVYLLRVDMDAENRPYRESLAIQDGQPNLSVVLSRGLPICASVLDLVSFNHEGIAKMDTQKNGNSLGASIPLQPNMIALYESLRAQFSGLCALKNGMSSLSKENKNSVNQLIKRSTHWSPSFDNNKIQFDIKRTRRYRSQYAQILLQHLNEYLSRAGLPHDFSRQPKNDN